jgi:hypothetical protein
MEVQTNRRSLLLTVGLITAMALSIVPALSQSPPADNMEIVRQKIQADKKVFIAKNMQLTQAEATAFWPVYDAFQTALGALSDRTIRLVREYASNYQSLSDATAKQLTEDYLAIQRDRVALLQSYLPKFTSVLPEKKVARYYQLENKAYAVILYDAARQIPLVK